MSFTTIVILVVVLAAIGFWAARNKDKKTVTPPAGPKVPPTLPEEPVQLQKDAVVDKKVSAKPAKKTTTKATTAKKAPAKTAAPKKVANKAAVVKTAKTTKKQ